MAARRLGRKLYGISDVVKVPSMQPYRNVVGRCRYAVQSDVKMRLHVDICFG